MLKTKRRRCKKRKRQRQQNKTKKGGFWWLFKTQCEDETCNLNCYSKEKNLNSVTKKYDSCCVPKKEDNWIKRKYKAWKNKDLCGDILALKEAMKTVQGDQTSSQKENKSKKNMTPNVEKFHEFLKVYGIQINDIVIKVDDECNFYNNKNTIKIPKQYVLQIFSTNFKSRIAVKYYQKQFIDHKKEEFNLIEKTISVPLEDFIKTLENFDKFFNLNFDTLGETLTYFKEQANDYLTYYFCGITVYLENVNNETIKTLQKGEYPRRPYLIDQPGIALNGILHEKNPYCILIYDENAVNTEGNPYIHLLMFEQSNIIYYKPPNPPEGEVHKYNIVVLRNLPSYDANTRRLLTKVENLDPLDATYFYYPPVLNF